MKKIIMQEYPHRKEFYALEIGSGNFQWCTSLANYIEKQNDLPQDIKIHIIGTRAESLLDESVVKTHRCVIYKLGAFKVEELSKEFQERGLDFEGKLDLSISHWCYRHLVDPLGTFIQNYNFMRPHGFLLLDGFFFHLENDSLDNQNSKLTRLFLDTKAPFLTKHHSLVLSLNHFALQKPDANPCKLPMEYIGLSLVSESGWQIGSECVTQFRRQPQETDQEKFCIPSADINHYKNIYGDKKMFDWLQKNGLFEESGLNWLVIQDKDSS